MANTREVNSSEIKLVEFEPLDNKKELKKFIDFQWKIYGKDKNWAPPLRLAVLDSLDTKKNPFYKHTRIRLWNAYRGSEHVGRIAAIIDEVHNSYHKERIGFWGFYETINDVEVSKALMDKAEFWIKAQGMTASRGPANPSLNHEAALLVKGFDDPPRIMMTYNPAYYTDLVEKQGYKKIKDLYAYELATKDFNPRIEKIADKVKARTKLEIRPINMKKFMVEAQVIREIFNDAWSENWGFVPMQDDEFNHMAKSMKDIIWPEFCLLAFSEGKPVGFSLSLPDVNQICMEIPNGKLLPFGIIKLLRGLNPKAGKITRVRTITLGIKKEWRASGLSSIFFVEAYRAAKKMGLTGGEMSWVLEDNREMNAAAHAMGTTEPYKVYRLYEKNL